MSDFRHTIHRRHHHFGWDRGIEPTLRGEPGATIHIECFDAGGGHFTVDSTAAEVDGALISIGDTHAAQGDGEIWGAAIESAMDVVVTLDGAGQRDRRRARLGRVLLLPADRPRLAYPAGLRTKS